MVVPQGIGGPFLAFLWCGLARVLRRHRHNEWDDVMSAPLTAFALICGGVFVLLMFFVWKHNHSTFQKQFAEWDSSFICQRCGAISLQ